jgi:hypothetical protein
MNPKFTPLLMASLLVGACASSPGGQVIIDNKGVDMARYQQDLGECQNYAQQVSAGERAATTAAGGAVVGGILGAVVGDSTTAKKGVGVGAVTGGIRGASSASREKSQVVKNCLRGRGYRVLN